MKKNINIAIVGLGNIGSRLYKEIISKKKDIGLKTNTKVTFDKRGNTDLFVTDSISPYTAPSALSGDFYVINKTPSTIGLKTSVEGPALFFTTTGDDKPNYSLVTNYKQETATVRRTI